MAGIDPSVTVSVVPDELGGPGETELASCAASPSIEYLVDGWRARLPHQQAQQILLQGLVCASRSLTKHGVRFLRYSFDLHARHGASMAPVAPEYKSV